MTEVDLAYLFAHPASLGLGFARPLGLLLVIAAIVFWLRPMRGEPRPPLIRIASYIVLVLGVAGTQLTTSLPREELSLVTAVDVSGSMSDDAVAWAGRYVANLSRSVSPDDQLAVLSFAASPHLLSERARNLDDVTIGRPADSFSTNLAAAIDQSLALFPADSEKALLLITDGNETVGDSRSHLRTLQALGVRVFATTPPVTEQLDVRITGLSAPEVANSGQSIPLRLVAHNPGAARPGVLNVYLDGMIRDSTTIELHPRSNTFDLALRAPKVGGHVIRTEISIQGDQTPQNNAREVSVTIQPPTQILLATNRRFSAITDVLRSRGFVVHQVSAQQLPRDVEGFAGTHAVILEDVGGRRIHADSLAALEEFVRRRGGGFVFTGGGTTFGDRAYQDTPMEKILPVTLEPRRPKPGKRDPLALFLLIDRSTSMGFNSRIKQLRDGEKLRYAIAAGTAVIKQLKDHDRVGVIVFDSLPHEIAALQPLRNNREALLRNLPRITENGGTDFFDALDAAARQLSQSRVSRKHVVLLTDGDTNRSDRGEYKGIIRRLASAQISVTTIRMGDNTKNLKLLQEISDGTGGSFHYVADAQMLPDLMLRDTSRALSRGSTGSEHYFPAFGAPHQLLEHVDEGTVPRLSNYAFSKSKPTSETLLHVARSDRQDPILSVWRYGLGRVAAFTASPGDDAEAWPAWNGYARFWAQLAQWASRRGSDHEFALAASRRTDSTDLAVRGFRRDGATAILSGSLRLADGSQLEAPFEPDGDGTFRASLAPVPPGRYRLTLRERSPQGRVREIDTSVAIPAGLEEESTEYSGKPVYLERLRELTAATGGMLEPTAADIVRRPTGERRIPYPLDGLLIPLAMTLYFIDIARRRIAAVRRNQT